MEISSSEESNAKRRRKQLCPLLHHPVQLCPEIMGVGTCRCSQQLTERPLKGRGCRQATASVEDRPQLRHIDRLIQEQDVGFQRRILTLNCNDESITVNLLAQARPDVIQRSLPRRATERGRIQEHISQPRDPLLVGDDDRSTRFL
jgi:hypothetical protein